ncbi:MAG: imidazoleglycerol-phosphate dehydratase HisB [Clostridiales bacterium]|jgi:imidazoleglycerol-phosphate dehydratase|nr:imidazoleglycerol-phosphate dehydratase HisB [Clostridiales bacterium]
MRSSTQSRKTRETDITLTLQLDGGEVDIHTGIGFFDHMLTAFATHGGFGLILRAEGDLHVDCHHTIEDTGIVLGKAFAQALGNKAGVARFGSFYVPMDEALAFCSVDISGRPYVVFQAEFAEERIGEYDTCMTEEFVRAFATNAGLTLHTRLEYGKNSHHCVEAIYKAIAHAMRLAVARSQSGEVLSTKGVL